MLRRVNHNQVRSELRSKGGERADKQTNKKNTHTHTRVCIIRAFHKSTPKVTWNGL